MFRKLAVIVAGCWLILLWVASLPQAQAQPLAQATAMPMQMDHTPTPMPMNGTSIPSGDMSGMPMSGDRIDANGATLKIASPANGAVVNDSSVIVKVQTTNLALGTDGVHFHLYVDGKVQGMSEGASSSIMAHDLTPGEHTLEVVLANGLHQELNASDLIKVSVQPARAAVTTSTASDNSALLIIGLVAAVVVLGGVGFVVMRRR